MKHFSDHELIEKIVAAVSEERKIIIQVLHYLREIERRRLYAARGYSSLHAFCVERLKYSDGAAHRRISAMRLLKDLPEVESALNEGKLTLTTVSQIQGFIKSEKQPYSVDEKRELLNAVQNKSKREVEKILIARSPENQSITFAAREKFLRQVFDEKTLAKLDRIRELTSHKNLKGNVELIDHMADIVLKKLEPKKISSSVAETEIEAEIEKCTSPEKSANPRNETAPSRYIPTKIKQIVWQRDGGMCTYCDPVTKKQCLSKYYLEFDHILPHSYGGDTTVENLRLRCRAHNQLHAMYTLGRAEMAKYMQVNS